MKVSCIIPVYKVDQYIRQCVESFLCQTYKDTEIILVNDGSPDNSPAICDQLAMEDSRIRVIHKENGGLSDARNTGLMQATGDYVIFMDGDDFWVGDNSLKKLVEIALVYPSLDFIGFNCNYYFADSNLLSPWVAFDTCLARPVDSSTAVVKLVKSGTFPMSACLKMLKRSFLIDNKLLFKKGQIAEDIPWFLNVLEATEYCLFINEYIYAYRQNVVGSITNSNAQKSFTSLFDIFESELSLVDVRDFCSEAKNALKSFLAYEYCILLANLNCFNKAEQKVFRNRLYSYRSVLGFRDNPKVKKAYVVYQLFGFKVMEFLLNQYLRIHQR